MAKMKTTSKPHTSSFLSRLREGALIGLVAVSLYLCLALFSFDPGDPGWAYTGTDEEVKNLVGRTGAWIADVFLLIFGYLAFVFPMVLAYQVWQMFRERVWEVFNWQLLSFRLMGLMLTLVAGAGLATLHFYAPGLDLREGSGGVVGAELIAWMVPGFSHVGTTLILLAVFLFGITALTGLSWLSLMDATGSVFLGVIDRVMAICHRFWQQYKERNEVRRTTKDRRMSLLKHIEVEQHRPDVVIEPPDLPHGELSQRVYRESQGSLFKIETVGSLPALNLLDAADPDDEKGYSDADLQAMSHMLELKLKDYGIEAKVVSVLPGPVITRFEIQPAPGVKVSRISGLAKDLARSLSVISVRVVEVVPGKPVVGIEIPNMDRCIVKLSEVLNSKAYDLSTSPLTLALGQDISGAPVVVDLYKMPHLLVAGTTGSGKSVALNAMILSILFKSPPETVRLIMIDPKMLELAVYEGIPHLLTPVVTDMNDASNALRWCIAEMERRYRLMATLGVRSMAGFNRKVQDAEKSGEPLIDPLWQADPLLRAEDQEIPRLESLPYIVVVIDELADMMMLVGKKVEQLIARIAQKARAAGIHLILATQRPSVDVITGLIKANIPTRIGFQVSSKVDSRTVLDQGGAEQLLGHGDMLYLPAGAALPMRVHGAFVDDEEVNRVVANWRELGGQNYLDTILEQRTDAEVLPGVAGDRTGASDDGEVDPLYDEAVVFVTESRRPSISAVQRKLRVGYNRAARMIETMEKTGVVSEMNSNGSREVLANAPPD